MQKLIDTANRDKKPFFLWFNAGLDCPEIGPGAVPNLLSEVQSKLVMSGNSVDLANESGRPIWLGPQVRCLDMYSKKRRPAEAGRRRENLFADL